LHAKAWPPHVRLGAFTGLLSADPGQAPAAIMQAIAGGDPLLRATAVAQIPTLEAREALAQCAAALPRMPPDAQVLLIRALARRPDGEAALRPVVTRAIESDAADVRLAAIEALGAVGEAASVPVLCTVLAKSETKAERQAAAAALRALEGELIDAAILDCMREAPSTTRPELIAVLSDRRAVRAIEELLRQAGERDRSIRSAALKALGRLAEPHHLPALIDTLAGLKGDAGRSEAERAIVQVSRKRPSDPAGPALAALDKAEDAATRCSLLRVLGAIADDKALQAVQDAAKAKDAAVQDAALRVLADWPDARPLDTLVERFRSTDNPRHRVLALRGCVRLLGLGDRPAAETLGVYAELAAGAKRVEDKKLVLSGLAKVADPATLRAIEPFLAQPATRDEAELALLSVARAVMGVAPSEAAAVARKLAADSKSEAVRKQAAAIARSVERLAGYVTAWQVAGPYEQKGKDGAALIGVAFPPEKAEAKGVAWRVLPVSTQGDQPWMLQLHTLFGGQDRACYARTWVHADKSQPARLEFGVDDGSKVWVNGTLVHADGTGGKATPGEHKVRVRLREGWNALLVKVTQYTGPWQFCLRIRSDKGKPLPGLRVRATPPKR
ncbi:MAG: HEAT repeat domain-containing protein, partial [Planctomycetota bacterium]